jgi:hypothetical protein
MAWVDIKSAHISKVFGITADLVPAVSGRYQYPVGVPAGAITGTVTVSGVLSKRRIWVHHRESGVLAAEALSDPVTGTFTVPNLDPRMKFYALAFDDIFEADVGTYECDAHDGLIPE